MQTACHWRVLTRAVSGYFAMLDLLKMKENKAMREFMVSTLAVVTTLAGVVLAGSGHAIARPVIIPDSQCIPLGVSSDSHGWVSTEVCGGHIIHRRLG